MTYYDVESYCVAITSEELAHSNRTKRSDAFYGFEKLDMNNATLLASGTGMKIKVISLRFLSPYYNILENHDSSKNACIYFQRVILVF